MHAFLIAMSVYGALCLLGLALSLLDGDRQSGPSLIAQGISFSLCLWAFALLCQGH